MAASSAAGSPGGLVASDMIHTHTTRDRGEPVRVPSGGVRPEAVRAYDAAQRRPADEGAREGSVTGATRDLRLDFFRGLALFSIFLDHVPDNFLAQFTLQSLMFADAAEVFILISGYTAGMVYGRAMERQGFLVAGVRIGYRVWQLYVAHVFLFVMFIAMMAYTVQSLNNSLYAEELLAADFLSEPAVAVIKALTLQFQPAFMDILPLYIVLLAGLPFVLAALRRGPWMVFAASLALWLAVQVSPALALPAYPGPDRVWYFNPLAWQALFFAGAWLGWRGTHGPLPWLDRRGLLGLAAGFALIAFVIRFSWTLHGLYDWVPALVSGKLLWPLLSKTDLGLLRFVSMLAVALLVARLIHPQAPFLGGRFARPFIICGRNSLHIFCLGIVLSILAHLVLGELFGGRVMQLVVSAVGIALMIAVAALMEWFAAAQAEARGPAAGPAPMAGGEA